MTVILLALIEAFLIFAIQKTPAIVGYIQDALNFSVHSSLIWIPLSILITINFFVIWKFITDIPEIGELITAGVDKFKNIVERLCARKRSALCWSAFLLGFSICLAYMVFVSKCTYVDPDTETYLFQARLFTMGKTYTPSPPDMRFIPARHLNYVNGKVYQLFPIGNASVLAFGEYLNAPWLIPPILSGILMVFMFLIMDSFVSRKAALLTAFLILVSPSFYAIGGAWWSENTSRCLLAAALYFFLKGVKPAAGKTTQTNTGLSFAGMIIAGLCWGFAFNTRPGSAVAFAGVFAVFWFYYFLKAQAKKRVFLNGILLFVVSLTGIALYLAVNHYYTGNYFKTPHDVEQKYTTFGLGIKAEGMNPDLSKTYDTPIKGLAYNHTLPQAFKRLIKNILPTVGMNIVGWGFPENIYGFNFITVGLAYFFIIFQLIKFKDSLDILLGTTFVGMLAFQLFYFYDNSIWNSLAVGARYYNEAIIIGLIPLLARGIISSKPYFQKMADRVNFKNNSFQFGVILLLILNWSFFALAQINYGYKSAFWDLKQQVAKMQSDKAVVFIKSEQLPLGNIPYTKFGQGKVVYFKLFGAKSPWVLDQKDPDKPDDWREFYPKYFKGRTPFLWEANKLIRLDVRGFSL